MADEADRAAEIGEWVLQKQLAHREEAPKPIGICHYCAEPVAGELRFCDIGCRDDWQQEQEALRRAGRR